MSYATSIERLLLVLLPRRTRNNVRMRLKTSSYLILGLVRGGVTSGYALKRFIEQQRTDSFWATTFAQIYPELAQLEEGGYLEHHEDPHGARQRRAYALTEKGERALMSWLRRETVPKRELRDEGLLRLAFADHLPREDAIELVRRLRARSEEAEREFREEIIPIGKAISASMGLRFPAEVCRMGAGYHAWAIEHLRQLEEELRDEQRADRKPVRANAAANALEGQPALTRSARAP
jgi:DNA-binding PadR family transcriptional regulator